MTPHKPGSSSTNLIIPIHYLTFKFRNRPINSAFPAVFKLTQQWLGRIVWRPNYNFRRVWYAFRHLCEFDVSVCRRVLNSTKYLLYIKIACGTALQIDYFIGQRLHTRPPKAYWIQTCDLFRLFPVCRLLKLTPYVEFIKTLRGRQVKWKGFWMKIKGKY